MRLIDADKMKLEVNSANPLIKEYAKEIENWRDTQPTVKAIPIEWIKGYITPFQVHHDSLSEELKENDGAGWVVDVLETMLREWEKENSVKISEGNYDSDEEYEEQMRCLDEN